MSSKNRVSNTSANLPTRGHQYEIKNTEEKRQFNEAVNSIRQKKSKLFNRQGIINDSSPYISLDDKEPWFYSFKKISNSNKFWDIHEICNEYAKRALTIHTAISKASNIPINHPYEERIHLLLNVLEKYKDANKYLFGLLKSLSVKRKLLIHGRQYKIYALIAHNQLDDLTRYNTYLLSTNL